MKRANVAVVHEVQHRVDSPCLDGPCQLGTLEVDVEKVQHLTLADHPNTRLRPKLTSKAVSQHHPIKIKVFEPSSCLAAQLETHLVRIELLPHLL